MQGTFEEDVIADIRERMVSVFDKLVRQETELRHLEKKVHILTQIGGSRDFEIFD